MGPPNILCEGPHSLPVALNASVVDDGVEAGAQDKVEDKEDVCVLAGARYGCGWYEAQEDEGVCQPDEEVEPGTDDVPMTPGFPGGAAQPDVLLVLVTTELEDVAV